jgi:hypothetical protein
MRSYQFFFFFCLCLLFSSCDRKYSPGDPGKITISQSDARRDFEIFRDIMENCHPNMTNYVSKKRLSYLFDSLKNSLNKEISFLDFYNKIAFLTNEIGCSHTYSGFPKSFIDTLYNRPLFFPLPAILVNGQLLVNSDNELPHGTEILAINDVSAKDLLKNLGRYNPAEGQHREAQEYMAASDLGFDYYTFYGGKEIFKTLIRDTGGVKSTVYLDAVDYTELASRRRSVYYYDVKDVDYSLKINEDENYALMRISTLNFEGSNKQVSFENFLKNSFELLKMKPGVKNLIIDIRENTGGDLYYCYLLNSYLSNKYFPEFQSLQSKIKRVPFVDYLSEDYEADNIGIINRKIESDFRKSSRNQYSVPDSLIEEWEPDKNRFSKNIYIIVNSAVSSSASYFAWLARKSGNVKIIGLETAGGDFSGTGYGSIEYSLPNSRIRLILYYASIKYSFADKKTGRGVIPDYYVPDTYESFKKNTDTQLKYILDSLILKNN